MDPQAEFRFRQALGRTFTPTTPIDEQSLFAGRKKQLSALIGAVTQKGQHAILYGERGVGKTSLANVLSSFVGSGGILAPRINCDGQDTFDSVWRKVLDEIQLTRTTQAPGFNNAPNQENFASSTLLPEPATPEGVRRALTIISQNTLPILIIDEFDQLSAPVKQQVADTVKTLSDHAVAATVILVGVADSVDQLIDAHESVERALVQVPMPRMSAEEIKTIINTGLTKLAFTIEPNALDDVVTLVQGLPHYAHLLGLHAAQLAHIRESTTVTPEIVHQAINMAIGAAQQSIKTAWHTATTSPRKDNLFADVLIACAMAQTDDLGYFAAQDVRGPLRKILGRQMNIANYAQHLADFCGPRKGPVLERVGEPRRFRFRFMNPLMQPYVVMQGYKSGRLLVGVSAAERN